MWGGGGGGGGTGGQLASIPIRGAKNSPNEIKKLYLNCIHGFLIRYVHWVSLPIKYYTKTSAKIQFTTKSYILSKTTIN